MDRIDSTKKIDPLGLESIADVLEARARAHPERMVFGWIRDGLELDSTQSFKELDRQARSTGHALLAAGCSPGDRVLLIFGTGPEFIISFFACLYVGAVAVPICPPRPNQKLDYINYIATDARPRFALTKFNEFPNIRVEFLDSAVEWIDVDGVCGTVEPPLLERANNDLAFLQYTSGSVGHPKGVMVSQLNLMTNLEMIKIGFEMSDEFTAFDWLPHYHDMGLIGSLLIFVYLGGMSYHIAPASFLQRPQRWLAGITRYGANFTGAPNFGYEHCFNYIREHQMKEIDLLGLRVAYCGAEPIRQGTLQRFAEKFGDVGFRFEAFNPCYGMAELTLFTSGAQVGFPITRSFKSVDLERGKAIAAESDSEIRMLVSSGRVSPHAEALIVNSETSQALNSGDIGEIWVRGQHITKGYYGKLAETEESYGAHIEGVGGGFFKTGDLGFIDGGELFVTGRQKDLIIIDARNLYPHDIERTVELAHPSIRAGRTVAFSVDTEKGERLVVAVEVLRKWRSKLCVSDAEPDEDGMLEQRRLLDGIRRVVAEDHAVALHKLVVTPVGGIPVTSSGKLKRRECRQAFIEARLAGISLG